MSKDFVLDLYDRTFLKGWMEQNKVGIRVQGLSLSSFDVLCLILRRPLCVFPYIVSLSRTNYQNTSYSTLLSNGY
jgi:hypothetical protein